MASNVFNFPGFFDREIDLSQEEQAPVGIPAGVIGASERGPAFVPITVGSFADYRAKFGDLNPRFAAPYAVNEHLKNKTALTFVKVLGAGANTTSAHIEDTRTKGIVNNAGFKISASLTPDPAGTHSGTHGAVQFLLARHEITGSEAFHQLGFTNNNSFFTTGSGTEAYLVRAMIFASSGSRLQVMDHDEFWSTSLDDSATANSTSKTFKIVISSSAGSSYSITEGNTGIKILTASLNPTSDNYFAKILNTDPEKFDEEKHLVYADFAIDDEVASVGTDTGDIVIASGSANTSSTSGDTSLPWLNTFGRFDTRFRNAISPKIISQPFGVKEYNLFGIESLDDGKHPNTKYKISISNIKKSSNPRDKHGSFALLVRAFDDTDTNPKILEQYNNLNLDPESENYICRVIGDMKISYNFDAEDEADRKLIVTGRFPNKSRIIRVIATEDVEKKLIPEESLPFGFRGLEALNTNSTLVDNTGSSGLGSLMRLEANLSGATDHNILGAIIPPMPYRFKVTRGAVEATANNLQGSVGNFEIVDSRFYWGVKLTRNKNVLNPNPTSEINALAKSYTKFVGIDKLDAVVTGSGNKDAFHNHKFTLARVALGNSNLTDITSSADVHMKEAAYIRNGTPDVTNYKITDDDGSPAATERITLASLLNKGTSAATFNAFSSFAKFTTILQGGFDGTNILDKNAATLNDRASSVEGRSDGTYGNVHESFVSPGFNFNQNGVGTQNNTINSYRVASDIITNPIASNINVLAVPGQREPLVTDYTADKVRDFGLALYTMDIPNYDSSGERVFEDVANVYIDPNKTATSLESRGLDNEYVGAYFPDVVIDDEVNNRRITVPATVAAISALSFNDKVSAPWFAPAGFNRAALDFVQLTKTRIRQPERERLFDVHINPIVKFPREGFVLFSQNTLEQAETALGSINVVRMLNDVKRKVIDVGNRIIWEQITPELRQQLVDQITPILNTVQLRQGIESFSVISDNTNNTDADVENNRINCKIVIVPTRSVEFISIDFIITRSGVAFG